MDCVVGRSKAVNIILKGLTGTPPTGSADRPCEGGSLCQIATFGKKGRCDWRHELERKGVGEDFANRVPTWKEKRAFANPKKEHVYTKKAKGLTPHTQTPNTAKKVHPTVVFRAAHLFSLVVKKGEHREN